MRHHAPEPIELASTNGGWQEMTVTGAKKNSQGRTAWVLFELGQSFQQIRTDGTGARWRRLRDGAPPCQHPKSSGRVRKTA